MVTLKEDYRAKAEQCLQTASEVTDVSVASLLRMVAADYFDLAERTASQQPPEADKLKER